jgi:hypothetical protein
MRQPTLTQRARLQSLCHHPLFSQLYHFGLGSSNSPSPSCSICTPISLTHDLGVLLELASQLHNLRRCLLIKATLTPSKHLPCVSVLPTMDRFVVVDWFTISEGREAGICAAVLAGEDVAAHVWVACGGSGKRRSCVWEGEEVDCCEDGGDRYDHDGCFS